MMPVSATYELDEYERRTVRLDSQQALELNKSRALTVAPTASREWDIQAAQYVGIVQASNVEIRVNPKVDVSRLLFMATYPGLRSGWEETMALLGAESDPIDAIAHAFCHHAEAALRSGILQGYRTVDEAGFVMRGRLREGDQLRRRFGMTMPVEITYDDFTIDIPENRLLATANQRLLRLRRISPSTRRRMRRIAVQLANVTLFRPGEVIPYIRLEQRNHRYRGSLALARLVVDNMTIEVGGRSRMSTAFLFDMNKVFEDFATAVLLERFATGSIRLSPQHSLFLDLEETVKLRPDLTWYEARRPVAVADLKYKRIETINPPNSDVYQTLAYCTALDLPTGHLIYASGNEAPLCRRVRNAGTELVTWSIPLDLKPRGLLDAISHIGSRIAGWERSDAAIGA